MKSRFASAICALLLVLAAAPAAAGQAAEKPAELPGDSVYRLDLGLENQDAQASKLADLRGKPVLIAMFYTSCQFTCPLIIESLKRTEKALGDDDRARLRVVLVSFDPHRDTPQVLKRVSAERHVDLSHWMLARTSQAGVRELAALLGVSYRALPNGDFNHSSMVTLLDAQGRIKAHSIRVGELDSDLLAALRQTLASAR